jgi:RNA-splicing ligase RtcB
VPTWINDRLAVWASELEEGTIRQAERTARLPVVAGHVALMPDAHVGIGATVGSVVPTDGAIIPSCVGVDIGCGMAAVRLDRTAEQLPDDLGGLLTEIESAVPAGVGRAHGTAGRDADRWLAEHRPRSVLRPEQEKTARTQFGTLGSGNHFVEVGLDEEERVWVVLHSGSRGIGNQLAQSHISRAKKVATHAEVAQEDPDLAYFLEGTDEFDHYVDDLLFAQSYAAANREAMLDAVLGAAGQALGPVAALERINCHHNYSAREHHQGRDLWVTRKGAIRAQRGDLGIIPGSMGTATYVVEGVGNEASFHSCSHGAGRRLSRGAARRQLTVESLEAAMAGRTWLSGRAEKLLDEHPDAYKDIEAVMADQADLVTVRHRIEAVLNYKGT